MSLLRRSILILYICFSALIILSCASKKINPLKSEELIFPFGNYQHLIKVTVPNQSQQISFNGIVDSTKDRLKIIGLSSFGTTLFRIDEDLKSGLIQKEFYLDHIKSNEKHIMRLYELVQYLMHKSKVENQIGGTKFSIHGMDFTTSMLDQNGIPRKIQISSQHFEALIDVTNVSLY